jgi:hypothetical protein
MKMTRLATWSIRGALAAALGAQVDCGSSSGNSQSRSSEDAGADSAAGASSSGGTSSGTTASGGANTTTGSSGGTSSGGATSDGGTTSSGRQGPVVLSYQTPTAPQWDPVFDNTGHGGDGFQWVPLEILDRQGLGTSITKSVCLFNDSGFNGCGANSTAGEYTGGITPNTADIKWIYGTNGENQICTDMWDTTHAPSGYGGTVAWNLVNNYGMSGIRGTGDTHDTNDMAMWLSAQSPSAADSYVTLDAYGTRNLGKLYIWNFNQEGATDKGLKNIQISTSTDGSNYTKYMGSGYPFQVPQASGSGPGAYNQVIDLNGTSARYVQITYNPVSGDGNWGDPSGYGLSAVRLYDTGGNKLLLTASAGSTATSNAYDQMPGGFWNMQAFTLGNYLYFVLHNDAGCCTPFETNASQLMRYAIANGQVDWSTLTAFDALPYLFYPTIPGGFSPQGNDARVGNYYQVVQFENLASWNDDDGYIYMLGADQSNEWNVWSDKSNVVLSRVPIGSVEDFNARQYWSGTSWVDFTYEQAVDLTDIYGNAVGPVGNMPGYFKAQGGQLNGKYVLVYMEDVNAGSYLRYADNPWGPWSEKYLLYPAPSTVSGSSPMAGNTVYNTGVVPFISNPGTFYFYLIVNSATIQFFEYTEGTSFASGFETTDPQPTWSDTVDFSSNVSGYQAGLNPQCSIRSGEEAHTGTSALLYSGTANGGNTTDCFYEMFNVYMPMTSSAVLDYWIYPQQDNGRYVAVDFECTDGTTLRVSGAVDQNGDGVAPSAGHGGNIPLNAWSEIKSNVGAQLAGKTVNKIWVGYDRPGSNGQYRGYIDDFSITQ